MPTIRQHIIAIGASAGGMEAIHIFFDNTPLDNVSYVVIQHLSPDHQSRLAELLVKHSKLTICLAENGMPVETNRVYVIPNKAYLTIEDGKLRLSNKRDKTGPGPHMTIDAFFVSLAADWGDKAIGVILSGTGHDGSLGIRAIHQAGGWIIAQDPASARFGMMPTNAIATGLVGAVLAPEAMPKAIEVYVDQASSGLQTVPHSNSDVSSVAKASEEKVLVAILELIKSQLPFDFTDYKQLTLFRRIRRRMAYHQLEHPQPYLTLLQENPQELESLAKDFLISVTSFFRDQSAFEMIRQKIIPALLGTDEVLKIWVAGCATGEEAYTLAILVTEYLEQTGQHREVKIFATDLDQAALTVASKGIYAATITQQVTPERLERFFTREGETYKINYDLRKMLIFAQHDLVKNPPYCNIDLVSCRNLLIYLNPVLQKKIFTMLHFGLKQGGYLFLGTSENALLLAPQFQEIDKKWKIYQKTTTSRSVQFEIFSLPTTGESLVPTLLRSMPAFGVDRTPIGRDLSESVSEVLMNHFGKVGVCLDEDQRVIQSFGDLTPYLLPKVFNFNLLELLPQTLSVAFATAFNQAIQSQETITITGIRNELGSGSTVNLVVKPFIAGRPGRNLLLVLLGSDTLPAIRLQPDEPFNLNENVHQYITYLEANLQAMKENVQVVQQKLESSTENLQSFNEELLSANEEMQSGNEELQSVNEELHTINTEYQLKIRELTEINNDLDNYFRSNVSGQLFVDKDLLLKKYSPAAVKHINLRESDIGRPLYHITTNIRFETLVADIRLVITNGETITREVQATTGQWYQVMVMAYLQQASDLPIGAMVTFYDITDLVLTRIQLEESSAELRLTKERLIVTNQDLNRTNVDLDNFVYTASHDLMAPVNNLKGLLELLSRKLLGHLDEKTAKILTMTDMSLVKLVRVMGDLTEIAKVQKDTNEEKDLLPFRDLLQDVLEDLEKQITVSGAKIRLDIKTETLLYTRKNLRSILYNLLSNALKYRSFERVPEIHLTFRLVSGSPVLEVTDNGLGLKVSQVAKLFSIYKRFHDHVEGTGLGLYMIRRMVENNGGCIEVSSQEGKGSTFTVHFSQTNMQSRIG